MIYIICPLDVEARVFIDYYKLKKLDLLPFNMYQNSDMILVVSGVGKTNALMATTAICGCIKPSESDILVNIGTCGGISNQSYFIAVTADKNGDNQWSTCDTEFQWHRYARDSHRYTSEDDTENDTYEYRADIRCVKTFD